MAKSSKSHRLITEAGFSIIQEKILAISILISIILFELTFLTSIVSAGSPVRESRAAMKQKLIQEKVVPDVVDAVPSSDVTIKYNTGVEVAYGNELTPAEVKDIPTIHWSAKEGSGLWLVAMVDPDAPSRKNHTKREILHFLVANIPSGKDISKGETLAEYIGAGPPVGTGLHRYVFLVYHQKDHHIHSSLKVPNTSVNGRAKFSIAKFAKEHHSTLVAANFFQAKYDDYVPQLHKQLGFAPAAQA